MKYVERKKSIMENFNILGCSLDKKNRVQFCTVLRLIIAFFEYEKLHELFDLLIKRSYSVHIATFFFENLHLSAVFFADYSKKYNYF